MATNFSNEDRRNAAALVSSGPNSVVRGAQGTRDVEARWSVLKQRTARALIADPDVALHLAYLASNLSRGVAIEASETLSRMILSAEGKRLPQTEIPDDASDALSGSADSLALSASGIGEPSEALLARIKTESTEYAQKHLLPNIKSGSRVQPKGDEAAAAYAADKREVKDLWSNVYGSTTALRGTRLLPVAQVRPEALKQPATSLQTTTGLAFPPESACAYALQLLASVASVEAMTRPVHELYRLQVRDGKSLPTTGLSVTEAEVSGDLITGLGVVDAGGLSVDPRTLGIRAGDAVVWLGHQAEVSAVSATVISLTNSDIPSGTKVEMSIEPNGAKLFLEAKEGITACLTALPTSRTLNEKLDSLDGESAAATRNLCQFLADSAAMLHPLTTETLLALERLGADEPSVASPLSEILLAYSPRVSAATREAATSLLDDLKSDGFDLAEQYLMEARLAEFFAANAVTATSAGALDIGLAEFSNAAGGIGVPTVRGR